MGCWTYTSLQERYSESNVSYGNKSLKFSSTVLLVTVLSVASARFRCGEVVASILGRFYEHEMIAVVDKVISG